MKGPLPLCPDWLATHVLMIPLDVPGAVLCLEQFLVRPSGRRPFKYKSQQQADFATEARGICLASADKCKSWRPDALNLSLLGVGEYSPHIKTILIITRRAILDGKTKWTSYLARAQHPSPSASIGVSSP